MYAQIHEHSATRQCPGGTPAAQTGNPPLPVLAGLGVVDPAETPLRHQLAGGDACRRAAAHKPQLHERARLAYGANDVVTLHSAQRHWLLQEQILAGPNDGQRHFLVMHVGCGHNYRGDLGPLQQLGDRRRGHRARVPRRKRPRPVRIDITDRPHLQPDLDRGLGVEAADAPGPDDSDAKRHARAPEGFNGPGHDSEWPERIQCRPCHRRIGRLRWWMDRTPSWSEPELSA